MLNKGPMRWALRLHVWPKAWLPLGGFGTRFGSFGGRLGNSFGKGLQPLWHEVSPGNIAVASGTSQVKYNLPLVCRHIFL